MCEFLAGDVVLSLKGRDKGELLLVIKAEKATVTVVNGKTRRTKSPKSKNKKHLLLVKRAGLNALAQNIAEGAPVSDKKVVRALKSVKD